MKRIILLVSLLTFSVTLNAQPVKSYSIDVEFFPRDARMWGYPVKNDAFMRGKTKVELASNIPDDVTFYLHGELKIDSILAADKKISYDPEKSFYRYDYSRVALKTTLPSSQISPDQKLEIHYSGFMTPSRARSLSDYMRIHINDGVYLRGYGYSPWFPVFIEPRQDTYKANFRSVKVSLPPNLKCVVGGELLSETTKTGRYTANWRPGLTDIRNIQCTARQYYRIFRDKIGVYYMNNQANGEKILDFATQLRNLFNTRLRRVHDSHSLYIIEMPQYGNISSANVVGISSQLFNAFDQSLHSKRTIAHELVHPYVHIPVKKENPFAALVMEGFPSFFQVYALEKTLKEEAFNLEKYMRKVEQNYIKRRETGKNRRGNALPPEKPILEISFDEVGSYKDQFVLSDRVWLFLYDLWQEMGSEQYDRFLKELFQWNSIHYHKFEKLVLKYLPGYKQELHLWLRTTQYPDSWRISK